ncbi:hypothetical protein B0H16DRAFT_1483815 [Mycena metata]|uniref:MACPF domain-containing protein n=1 Tax=Mycena metata TaxID=1033252 RepID=A0AAD7GQ50_9AGAR|nr:hypothetical protein B0H16DRAFT_1483815 [Mycena metata]
MAANITIIVVLGSRKAGERLLASHKSAVDSTETGTLHHGGQSAQGKVQLVSGYLPKRRFLLHALETPAELEEVEQKVAAEITKLGAIPENVGGIVFMCNEKYLDAGIFPFHVDSKFLELSGERLFQRLMVVPLMPDFVSTTENLIPLSRKGMQIHQFTEPRVVLPWLLTRISKGEDARRIEIQDIYIKASKQVRRSHDQAVILLAGHSGHGKSKTINRLIGRELLNVGRGTLGSTTKVIQRVEVHNRSRELLSDITVAFDDTPGLEDNTFEDRELNALLLRAYKVKHCTDIYPNVILLVAAWETITPDAHNEPSHFTSAIGKTIYALYRSNLVDDRRANIVVVVTKSLSSFHQFDDYKAMKEKHVQWRIEEGRRRGIITDLQRKMFPQSSPWEIVFIENGGGTNMSTKFPVLPDRQLSHQNLYDAIHNIIKRPSSDGSLDLVGIQALQVLTGAASLGSLNPAPPEILVSKSTLATMKPEQITTKILPQSPRDVIQNLADTYFGVTYNNALGTFGCINVLQNQAIVPQPANESGDFERMPNPFTLPGGSSEAENDRLQSYHSSDWAFRAAVSKKSHCWIMHRMTQVVVAQNQRLSEGMRNLIRRLPPWSPGEEAKYRQFFTNYGTHVITRLVLGGTVRAVVDSTNDREQSVMIFRDGGASVAAELTVRLEQNFPPQASSSRWETTRDRWIQALEKEPVFCPDHQLTEYKGIYELDGLTNDQRSFLRAGCQAYIAWRAEQDKSSDRKGSRTGHDSLQREFNLAQAVKDLLAAVTEALYRFQEGR